MRTLKFALLATVAVAGITSAASAADLIVDPGPSPPVVDNFVSGFSWEGPYAGLWVSGQSDAVFGLGADLGVNVLLNDNIIAGVEGNVGWLAQGDTLPDSLQGQVNGKLGFVTGNLAFYGLAGAGYNDATLGYTPVGVGAEVGLTDSLSVKGEYQYQVDWDNTAENAQTGKVGLNWHF
ncbi:MAG: porin family protein [Devosia sp.]|uniref:outer membrane protein n=1 Tax=Devosia sp. TaxID=1871048 RepID=UPI0026300F5D|nr:outer membrane beta-barrel protein [Devosia sp.]MDB5539685.1 porin family protein [Devosia sp.]